MKRLTIVVVFTSFHLLTNFSEYVSLNAVFIVWRLMKIANPIVDTTFKHIMNVENSKDVAVSVLNAFIPDSNI